MSNNTQVKQEYGARELILTDGQVALIDEQDWERVSRYNWWPENREGVTLYAYRRFWANGKGHRVRLHRFILCLTDSRYPFVDHKNRNGLDCRRQNLRIATYSQSASNVKKPTRNTSGYKGVVRNPRSPISPWLGQIKKGNKNHYLGVYKTPLEAALAYDKAAKELHGEFASLNFPEEHNEQS